MTFQEWVKAWFDHSESEREFWIYAPPEALEPAKTLDYATLLFAKSGELLKPYSDTQIGNALYGFINEMGSPLYCLRDASLSVENRVFCIQSVEMVFRDVFALRCGETLGHKSEAGGSLGDACYMWWDIFPAYTGCFRRVGGARLENAVLEVQRKILDLRNAACQESALHGLGHWQRNNEKKVNAIIQAAIDASTLHPSLFRYAETTRKGMVL